uniref:Replication factor A C-terminal domain-containing protein n=1 Tax=Brassica oleracea var. oleracea TaxID=109376 RepID=A0A0D3D6Z7_BRAOL
MKPNGKSPITSDYDAKVMFFRDVSPGSHETQLRFRLIHFWEAWNPLKKTLIGLEMLLIDEHGFISPGRIERYLPKMKPGSVYRLNNFYGSSNKSVYRVFDHAVTDFQANCDCKGDLYGNLCYPPHHLFVALLDVITYFLLFLLTHLMNNGIDVVGHMKLVNGQSIIETPVLDEVEIARARHVLWTYDEALPLGPGCKRLLQKKFKSYENTPTVLLVKTVNTKSLGGTLVPTSMSSSRVFMDYDVQPTIDYYWLGPNPQSAERVNAEVVTKLHGSTWYYISCSGYHTKATKGPTSLMCSKCGKVNIAGVAQYRAQISVYDNSEQAVFVLLGDASYELTGKHAS